MLPGDYLGMRLTGEIFTTVSGLSEGMLWDYKKQGVADKLLEYYGVDPKLIANIVPTFGDQGKLTSKAASELGLKAGVPVSYRAGDQPNNAFSLKTLDPGEIAATAGTSGVIYGIVGNPASDKYSRVNAFAHVNHKNEEQRLGILLCVNGTGIMNSWLRRNVQVKGDPISYEELNTLAAKSPIGSEKLAVLPFGNGAERVLQNKELGASFHNLDLNRHGASHLSRAVQEGIVFALGYGFEVMNAMGLQSKVIRAGKANMFLSETFCEAFTNVTGARIELFNTDGSAGAARGAGVGIGYYDLTSAFKGLTCIGEYEPDDKKKGQYQEAYTYWKKILTSQLNHR
jgi:xylulokinase